MRWGKRCLLIATLLLAVPAWLGLLAASAASSSPRLVRIGASPPTVPGAIPLGALSAAAPLHVTVVLKPRDPAGLERFVTQVSDPGSPRYRDYLTPAQFGQRFGASQAELQAVRASLRAHGLRPGSSPPNRLSIPLTAPVRAIERAFSTRLERARLPGGRRATIATAAPAVDAEIAPGIQAIVGLNGAAAPRPLLLRSAARRAVSPNERPHAQTGGPQPCPAASATGSQDSAYTADQIASAYGFPGLYSAGDLGQGATVGIYELEPNDPSDIDAYQACYGTHASVSYIAVDGGAGSGEGSGEAALDIEDAIGLAPQASFLVYQAPNANQSVPGSGPYDLFSRMVVDDRVNVIVVSWGECEQLEGPSGASAESTLFQEAAAQGQSIVAATGDSGSEDCNGASNTPQPQLAVDDPASQPFITGVGGTSMTSTGPPPAQTTWNDGGSAVALTKASLGAGGGGVSTFWAMPGYQSGADPALHVVGPNSSRSPCGASSGYCREVPDVAADADPNHGYVIYYNGSGADPTVASGWQAVGGTSAASPVWGALVALADASSGCHGSPVGFANPALYMAGSSDFSSDFSDVTTGNNDYTGTNGGLYPAGSGYDMATGLGTPNGTALVPALCRDTLRLRNPGHQATTLGAPVSLQLTTTGPAGGSLDFVAKGLPSGLTLSRSTGRITGRPNRIGTFTVGVAVVDSTLALAGTAFSWTVAGAPRLSGVSVSGVSNRRPRIRMTVSAGRDAPGIRGLTIALPGSLRFVRAKVTVAGPRGEHVGYTPRLLAGRLLIILSRAISRVSLRITYPAIATRSHGRRHGPFRLRVSVTDSRQHISALTVHVR